MIVSVIYVFSQVVKLLLTALQIMMFLRAILSWLPIEDNSAVENFLCMMTEPVIMPVRAVLNLLGVPDDMPVDIAFFVAFLLLSIIRTFF